MLELKLVAAGSSPLIADEIKSIAQSFLGEEIFIDTALTDDIKSLDEKNFCVCAVTQAEKLSRVISPEKLFVFDLHPTTKFFLDIAKIPEGAEVYVFNNRLPYTKLLAQECRSLGVDKIFFHSIAYDEMPAAEVRDRLQKARYIIGVDRLVGENFLFQRYRDCLRPDVKIIAGKRAASVASASKLLAGIAEFYHAELSTQKKSREPNPTCGKIIRILKSASAKAVIGQIGGTSCAEEHFGNVATFDEQLSILEYLREKFLLLSA